MRPHEAAQVLEFIYRAWPNTRWTEQTEHLWLADLVQYRPEDAAEALRALRKQLDWAPTWHQFVTEVAAAARARSNREAADRAALPAAPPEVSDEARLRLRALMNRARASARRAGEHNHRLPKWAEGRSPAEQARARVQNCPLCSGHDHSDRTLIGFSVHRQFVDTAEGRKMFESKAPVLGYRVTCPKCGDREVARLECDLVTPEGIPYLRAEETTVAPSDGF